MIEDMVDEIRGLSAKLAEYKKLYFIQQQERELAGQEYNALQDEMDANKQVVGSSRRKRASLSYYLGYKPTNVNEQRRQH